MSHKTIVIILLSFVTTVVISYLTSQKNRIVFCDVGQGAATLIQLGYYQLLVDTGPDSRVLPCIGRHIPFFDHEIEVVIISHNQKDHNGGLYALHNKYVIGHVYGPNPKPPFVKNLYFTDVSNTVTLRINKVVVAINKASQSSDNLNDSANVVTITTDKHTIFLSSDINGVELKRLLPPDTTVIEVPHHGSKYGLYPDSLDLADPLLSVISVGKKNTYGHPSKEALDILKAKGIPIWRTDQLGELVLDL